MTAVSPTSVIVSALDRARLSAGASSDPIYQAVAELLARRHARGGILVDVGCGHGHLWRFLSLQFNNYVGVDVAKYEGFPADGEFRQMNLDTGRIPLPDGVADVVAGVETIEHLENPRAFVRELSRLCKPSGWVVVTTPNQLSFLSKLTLIFKNQFNAFTESSYPCHLTALLEVDLRRIAAECGLVDLAVQYSGVGRIPGTARHFPGFIGQLAPRAFSDNIVVIGRKPSETAEAH